MQGLGHLEAQIMDVFWRSAGGDMRVRDVIDGLAADREPAYTTVMTVMDILHRKGWLDRERRGRAYWYCPSRTREDAAADALRAVLASTSDPAAALLQFVLQASESETETLARGLEERGR